MDDDLKTKLAAFFLGARSSASYQGRDGSWQDVQTDRWSCRLATADGSAKFAYHMGVGHKGKAPSACDLLESLLSDARIAENGGYDDFLSEFGYDDNSDNRKTWRSLEAQSRRLHRLFPEFAAPLLWGDAEEMAEKISEWVEADPARALPDPKRQKTWGLLSAAAACGSMPLIEKSFAMGLSSLTEPGGMPALVELAESSGNADLASWLVAFDASLNEAKAIDESMAPAASRAKASI